MAYLKPDYIQENQAHKIIMDFNMPTSYLIEARRPDLILVNRKKITC